MNKSAGKLSGDHWVSSWDQMQQGQVGFCDLFDKMQPSFSPPDT